MYFSMISMFWTERGYPDSQMNVAKVPSRLLYQSKKCGDPSSSMNMSHLHACWCPTEHCCSRYMQCFRQKYTGSETHKVCSRLKPKYSWPEVVTVAVSYSTGHCTLHVPLLLITHIWLQWFHSRPIETWAVSVDCTKDREWNQFKSLLTFYRLNKS